MQRKAYYRCTECRKEYEETMPLTELSANTVECTCGNKAKWYRSVIIAPAKEGVKNWGTCGNWPMKSEALGVHPSQVNSAREHAKKIGIPTEYTNDGCPVFTSKSHRKRFCEHPTIRVYDRDGGYGDPQKS